MSQGRTVPLLDVEHPTPQQVLDAVAAHAAQMTSKCSVYFSDGTPSHCVYRDGKGNACFIGRLLTDEEAEGLDDNSSGTGAGTLFDQKRLPSRLLEWELRHLLPELQAVHDTTTPADWPRELRRVAAGFGLSTAAIDKHFAV